MKEGELHVKSNNSACTMSVQEWTTLLQAYISWMNSQLRKGKGYRRVLDLTTDLQDGVALAQLVEVLGGNMVEGLDEAPCTLSARRANVDKLVKHLMSSQVKIPDTAAKSILEGDLRRVLQLIHSVAAHFKPNSVQKKSDSVSSEQQSEAPKINQAKIISLNKREIKTATGNKERKTTKESHEVGSEERQTCPIVELPSVTAPSGPKVVPGGSGVPDSQDSLVETQKDMSTGKIPIYEGSNIKSKIKSYRNWEEERKAIVEDVVKARRQLLYLREILMRGYKHGHDEAQRNSGRFDKTKAPGYRSSKMEDNAHIVQILEENERLRLENDTLTKKVETQEKQITKLEDSVQLLEDKVDTHKQQYEEVLRAHKPNSKVSPGTPNGDINGDTKDFSAEGQNGTLPVAYRLQHHEVELQIVKDSISSLRRCFLVNDPFQHTLDTIEESLATLTERVKAAESSSVVPNDETLSHFSPNREKRRTPVCSLKDYTNNSHYINAVQESHTKVVYFLSKSTTPFLSSIPKRIGEITLKDFKIILDRPGQFRYHFKTLDREYGMVKEEVLQDDDLIPAWDNKIVGWVEEDD